jgi:hypothetical protein
MDKGGFLMGIRLAFALVSTVLGSLAIDMAVFSGDLAEYRKTKQTDERAAAKAAFMQSHGQELLRADLELEGASQKFEHLQVAFLQEIDGSGGTGKYGQGKVAKAKEAMMLDSQSELEMAKAIRAQELADLESEADLHAAEKVDKRKDALLSQLRDLHDFILADGFTIGFYLFFFAFIFMLECFFVLYKSFVSESIFEQWMEAEEAYGKDRLRTYRSQKSKATQGRDLLGSDYGRVLKIVDGGPRRVL